jgi:hypothetical protein
MQESRQSPLEEQGAVIILLRMISVTLIIEPIIALHLSSA